MTPERTISSSAHIVGSCKHPLASKLPGELLRCMQEPRWSVDRGSDRYPACPGIQHAYIPHPEARPAMCGFRRQESTDRAYPTALGTHRWIFLLQNTRGNFLAVPIMQDTFSSKLP